MINMAIIGCGYWGPNLIRNCLHNPRTNLIWACDLDKEKLTKILKPYPQVKTTLNLEDILNDTNVDAVAIATPVNTHYPIAKVCLKAGKHVLVEKPFAANISEGRELVKLAEQNDRRLMCDHTFCYTGAVRKIKEIINSGELGDVLYFDSIRINLGLFQHDVNVIWDLAVHDIAILDYLIDEKPILASAHGVSHAGNDIENIAYVTLTYDSPLIAHFHVNWLSPVKIRKTIIGGSQKMLEWNDLAPDLKIRIYDKGIDLQNIEGDEKRKALVSYRSGDVFSPHIDNTEALHLVINEFADSIQQARKPLTDGHAALQVLRVLEAAGRSIKADGANVRIDYS